MYDDLGAVRAGIPASIAGKIRPDSGRFHGFSLINAGPIAAGGTATGSVNDRIDPGYYFRWVGLVGYVAVATAVANIAPVGVNYPREAIAFNTSGLPSVDAFRLDLRIGDTQWFNTPAPFGSVVGTSERPMWLPTPQWIGPGTSIAATLTNTLTATFDARFGVTLVGERFEVI